MGSENSEKISGEVDSVVYRNDENGFAVILLRTEDGLLNVVGVLGGVEEGEDVVCTGRFVSHQKFGEQFRCELCERSLPKTAAAVQRYLASGAVKGIGAVKARAIVKKFGDRTLEILEKDPESLAEIDGITHEMALKISEQFKKDFVVRSLSVFLFPFEISAACVVRAVRQLGDNAELLIRSDPYLLCSPSVGAEFVKADSLAKSLGIPYDNDNRIKAGISYVLRKNAASGHTCLPQDKLCEKVCEFLIIEPALFEKAAAAGIEEEDLCCYIKNGRKFIMLYDYFKADFYTARRLTAMKECTYDNKIDFSETIDEAEKRSGIKYENLQREAINLALSYGFLVITGGPGTGKTTTLNAIIDLYKQQGMNVMVAAPTGRAAKRLSELTGCEAKTIHRLLEVKPSDSSLMSFVHNETDLLECDALILDEMSMVDSLLFEAALRAIKLTCKLVLVGDIDQLPSVGAGNVLKDIIDSRTMPVVRLTQIFRQAQQSAIVTNAHKIVSGEHIDLTEKGRDFFFFQRLEYRGLQSLIADLVKTRLPKAYGYSPFDDIQILSPTKKGPAGTAELNRIMQNELNPEKKGTDEIKTSHFTYRIGDKVMQTKNDYDIAWKKTVRGKTESGSGIFNGDIGRIVACDKKNRQIIVDFEGREAVYGSDMLSNLELAYAITVHKSQGNEFEAVVLAIFDGYDKLFYRNLLYTAITRARKLLIIVGNDKRVGFMIDNRRRNLRYTCLKNMLAEMNGVEKKDEDEIAIL